MRYVAAVLIFVVAWLVAFVALSYLVQMLLGQNAQAVQIGRYVAAAVAIIPAFRVARDRLRGMRRPGR